jgi:predicted CoA-binding protein
MASDYESFWEHQSYAVVGHSAERDFPRLTYGGLKQNGKTVYPVDPSVDQIDGDPTYPDLNALPNPVDAVVLEVPKPQTKDWVQKVVDHGVKELWVHMDTETLEALELARSNGIHVRSGTCAVMYLRRGFTYHSIHRIINQLLGKY